MLWKGRFVFKVNFSYIGCFTTCGRYCRRRIPMSLWSKKFI